MGVVGMLAIRLPNECGMEIPDMIPDLVMDWQLKRIFLSSLPWRTERSWNARTSELLKVCSADQVGNDFDQMIAFATNVHHPWNALYLNDRLKKMPLAERDRKWTFWANAALSGYENSSALDEIRSWADQGHLSVVPDEELLLLAVTIAWLTSSTVVEERTRLITSLTRIVANRCSVASDILALFLDVDDPYVVEAVLIACAGSSQYAQKGDPGLTRLASITFQHFFEPELTPPHLLVRHYASEICAQAEQKGAFPLEFDASRFRPPWRSKLLRAWSEKSLEKKKEEIKAKYGDCKIASLLRSVEPNIGLGFCNYGDFGRYVMEMYVQKFLKTRIYRPAPKHGDYKDVFDAHRGKRYIIQRVFEVGWDCAHVDTFPGDRSYYGQGDKIERLSKKYQWIGLFELLGMLSDQYYFRGYEASPQKFRSAKQICQSYLMDPFICEPTADDECISWQFAKLPVLWWTGGVNPFPVPVGLESKRKRAAANSTWNPRVLLELNDGNKDWIALHTYFRWLEPIPVWGDKHRYERGGMEWALQSYLVQPDRREELIRRLSSREVSRGRLWLEEPEFGQPFAALTSYPANQAELSDHCLIDGRWETEDWTTGAIATTCSISPQEEKRRPLGGSIPSPQLSSIGDLRWTGYEFDFAAPGCDRPSIRFHGRYPKETCIVDREELKKWLNSTGYHIVWRCYGTKSVWNDHSDRSGRAYWMTFQLDDSGRIGQGKGATAGFPTEGAPSEQISWAP